MTAEHGATACAIEVLERGAARAGGTAKGTILVVAAHPDDETIGVGATLGAWLASGWRVYVLHVTDGAPEKIALRYALRHLGREEAAAVRRAEVTEALRAGGLTTDPFLLPSMGIADQDAALEMTEVASKLATCAELLEVDLLVTHPYEGGHPDHDAVAFAAHAAAALRAREGAFALAEMTSYHTRGGSLVTGAFREGADAPTPACSRQHPGPLDDAARARKRRMLDAFATQAEILGPFRAEAEPLRCAPRYDFTRPPHEGKLHYESLPFDWTGARWCELARASLRNLGLAT
ncbi:MAG TPA: PIG-L family deacetylase [Polyangiaceae bacterium]|nr:PIG-L family deacetylase [Polyangiaceae bacterium]